MGHLGQKEDILKQLQKRLHQNPVGLPEHASVYEILSILFNEKEAKVGSKFPPGLVPSKRSRMRRESTEGNWRRS